MGLRRVGMLILESSHTSERWWIAFENGDMAAASLTVRAEFGRVAAEGTAKDMTEYSYCSYKMVY